MDPLAILLCVVISLVLLGLGGLAIWTHPALKSPPMAERTTADGRCYACAYKPGIRPPQDHNPEVCPYLLALRDKTAYTH
jgi:hypothetical protein